MNDQLSKTAGARRGTMGCRATLHRGGFSRFSSSGGGGGTSLGSAGGGSGTSSGSVGGGGGTSLGSAGGVGGSSLGSAGGGGDTSSLPRFLDGSLDATCACLRKEKLLD
jgi:hypothetical protein